MLRTKWVTQRLCPLYVEVPHGLGPCVHFDLSLEEVASIGWCSTGTPLTRWRSCYRKVDQFGPLLSARTLRSKSLGV